MMEAEFQQWVCYLVYYYGMGVDEIMNMPRDVVIVMTEHLSDIVKADRGLES